MPTLQCRLLTQFDNLAVRQIRPLLGSGRFALLHSVGGLSLWDIEKDKSPRLIMGLAQSGPSSSIPTRVLDIDGDAKQALVLNRSGFHNQLELWRIGGLRPNETSVVDSNVDRGGILRTGHCWVSASQAGQTSRQNLRTMIVSSIKRFNFGAASPIRWEAVSDKPYSYFFDEQRQRVTLLLAAPANQPSESLQVFSYDNGAPLGMLAQGVIWGITHDPITDSLHVRLDGGARRIVLSSFRFGELEPNVAMRVCVEQSWDPLILDSRSHILFGLWGAQSTAEIIDRTKIALIDTETLEVLRVLDIGAAIVSITLLPDQEHLIVTTQNTFELWHKEEDSPTEIITQPYARSWVWAVTKEGLLFVTPNNGNTQLFSIEGYKANLDCFAP